MKRNELFSHYSLSECAEQEKVLKKLDKLTESGKIELYYEIRNERFKIVDLELDDTEVINLIDMFYENDVIPDMDYEDVDDEHDIDMGYDMEFE